MLFLRRSGQVEIPESYYLEDLYTPSRFKRLDKLNTAYNRRNTFYKPGVYFNGPDSLFDLGKHPLFQWAQVIHLHWVVKMLDWEKVFAHKDKAFVWTLHDMNPFTGGEHYQTGYKGEFAKVSKRNIAVKKKALINTRLKIVTPSQWLADLAKASEVFNDRDVFVIRNPIDDGVFKPLHSYLHKSESQVGPQKKNILFVAENPHDERKGFRLLLKALDNLDPDAYRLSVIGNKKFVESIFSQAFFHGVVNDEEELVKIYNSADLFVIPSLEDNLPNTVSEALLCGTPVVGMAVGGIKEMVIEGRNGFISPDAEHLQATIEKALRHHFERPLVRNHSLKLLPKDEIISRMIDVYST